MSRKKRNPKSRWEPLPEDASVMQVMIVPEIDDQIFHFEQMSNEDLINFCTFIEQSNNTLEVENMIIEKYLRRMNSSLLVSQITFLFLQQLKNFLF